MRRAFTLQLYPKPIFGDLQGMYPTLQFPCPAPHCNELRTFVISTRHETLEHTPGVMTSYEARCNVCETTATFVGHAEKPPELPSYVICTNHTITKGPTPLSSVVGNLFGHERHIGESDNAYRQRILDSLVVAGAPAAVLAVAAGSPAEAVDDRSDFQRGLDRVIKKGSF